MHPFAQPMSQILNRILSNKEINCQIVNFGDKVRVTEEARWDCD